jgi:hypothetical protein
MPAPGAWFDASGESHGVERPDVVRRRGADRKEIGSDRADERTGPKRIFGWAMVRRQNAERQRRRQETAAMWKWQWSVGAVWVGAAVVAAVLVWTILGRS